MDTFVFFAVLAAALLHGSWNVLLKRNLDRFLSLVLIQSFMGLAGLGMILLSPAPALASLPYAVASGVIHIGYNLFLARSYQTGDLSQVYPIARGTAPLFTLIGTFIFTGDLHSWISLLGIGVLVLGIWATAGDRGGVKLDRTTLLFALGTAGFIGVYTIVDGLGARMSGSPTAYAGYVFVFDGVFLLLTGLYMRGRAMAAVFGSNWTLGLIGGVCSALAYWIAIWAMTKAPIASVAALRETSILFVIAMSALVLKEKVGPWRYAGGALIVAGAALLRLS